MKQFYASALVLLSFVNPTWAGTTVSQENLTALQATMQSFVDQSLVDGAILQIDYETGKTQPIYPGKAHPIVMAIDDKFVLCSEFRDANGLAVNADFYIAGSDDKFVVYAAHYGPHPELEALAKAGKATMVNQ
jgi:hypothetical protein